MLCSFFLQEGVHFFYTSSPWVSDSSATSRIIGAKDHASVQINIGHLNADGVYTREFTTYAFSGFIRAKGESGTKGPCV